MKKRTTIFDRDPPHLYQVSTLQIMQLWEELMACVYGKNGYGGNVAEIYLYTVMPSCPYVTDDIESKQADQEFENANKNLYDLCKLFEKRRNVKLFMFEGEKPTSLSALVDGKILWTHRVHIGVKQAKS